MLYLLPCEKFGICKRGDKNMRNKKGEKCPYDDRIFCQEGFCDGCSVYEHYSTEKYKKWKEGKECKTER